MLESALGGTRLALGIHLCQNFPRLAAWTMCNIANRVRIVSKLDVLMRLDRSDARTLTWRSCESWADNATLGKVHEMICQNIDGRYRYDCVMYI